MEHSAAESLEREVELAVLRHERIADCAVLLRGRSPDAAPAGTCVRCGIPDTYPGVTMDAEGVCGLCELYATKRDAIHEYFRTVPEFGDLVRARAGGGEYDCLLLFSGGKDSTYVLHQLVDLGLRVMTFTFDNGFISRTALRNVETITEALGIEHVTARRQDQKKIFFQSLTDHKSVCNGCFRSLLDLSTDLAHERGIPSIITGLSRGQIIDERLSWFYRQGVFDVETIERDLAVGRRIYHQVGGDTDDRAVSGVEVIDYYRYSDVTKADIREFLNRGSRLWAQPKDTGFCSSNCMINDVGVYVHNLERGFHNYEAPTRWEVRLGHLSLAEADEELRAPVNVARVKKMLARIGYPDPADHKELGRRLAVYYVPRDAVDPAELRTSVAANLPEFLVPEHWTELSRIPRTAGVVSLRDLPVAEASSRFDLEPPRPPAEERSAPLTAAQQEFVDRGFAQLAQQARAVLLDLPEPAEPARVRKAGLHLLLRHEELRSRFVRGGEMWRRKDCGARGGVPVTGVDLSRHDLTEHPRLLRTAVDRLRARLDLTEGPVIQFALVRRSPVRSQLLIVAHELVVPARSWQGLLADLDVLCHRPDQEPPTDQPLPDSAPPRRAAPAASGPRLPEMGDGVVRSHRVRARGGEFDVAAFADAVGDWLGGPVAVDVEDHTAPENDVRFRDARIRVNRFGDLDDLVVGTAFGLAELDDVDPTALPSSTPYAVEVNVAGYHGETRVDWRCSDEMYAVLTDADVPDRVWRS